MPHWLKIFSEVTCSHCGHKEVERMPKYATKTSYTCSVCKETTKPSHGSCCVYCSYGSVPCPKQQAKNRTLNLQENDDQDYEVLV